MKKVSLHELATDSDMSLYYKLENSGRGIGPKTATTIIKERQFFIKDLVYICNNMPNVITSKGLENDKVTLCKTIRFSGIRDKELENRLSIQGHDCSEGSVTKTTDFLLIPFVGYTSSKVDKANKYGVKILTLDEFRLNESSYLSEV